MYPDARATRDNASWNGSAKRRVTVWMRWIDTACAVYAIARIDWLSIKCTCSSSSLEPSASELVGGELESIASS